MKINLFVSGSKTYAGGAYVSAHGFCLPPVTPFFDEWASAASNPPAGIGSKLECGWYGVYVDDPELYAIVQTTDGVGKCISRYTLNTAAKPMTMTHQGDVDVSSLGIDAKDFQTSRYQVYDHTNGSVLINCWYSAAPKSSNMGRWEVDQWPFSSLNKTWIGVPSSYGGVEAGKIARNGLPLLDIANDKLYVASTGSRKVQTVRWSDGVLLGEFTFDDAWSTGSPFRMVGLDQSNGYVIGGSDYGEYDPGPPAKDAGNGEIWAWDTTNPNAWEKVGALPVIPSSTDSWDRGRFWSYGRTPLHLYYWYGRFYAIQPHICDLLGFDSDDIAMIEFVPQYWGYSYGAQMIRRVNLTTGAMRQYPISQVCSYSRSGVGLLGLMLSQFVEIGGQPWMISASSGTIDHFAEQDKFPQASGVVGVHVGVGQIDVDISSEIDYPIQPSELYLKVAVDGIDSEYSTHPGKWRVTYVLNGVPSTDWRAGPAELGNLDQVVHGLPKWPEVKETDTFVVRLECSSGFFHNYAPVQGNPGDRTTPNVPVGNPGPPNDVIPIFRADPVERGGGLY